ncbi:FAD/NAD(P)-binding protein [Robbsia andropogonis]|uniref:FAD/NAD(P)-binding protein n=1 Tax=Robbsia andropogonis TaxID=28092 RepID=UPI003D258091
MRIAIIGLGCSGTMVLRAIADRLREGDPIEIRLFESQKEVAAGIPYGAAFNDDCFVLNMQTSLLGAHPQRPEEFMDWLAGQSPSVVDGTDYIARTRMGGYLASVLQASMARLRQLGIACEIVRDEVCDMQVRGNEYLLFGTTQTYTADRVVLAPGHLKKRKPEGSGKRYIANPYHALHLVRAIPPNAKVGIVGSKLTAVDMAILLREQGGRRISMFSGSGRLPLVRGVRPPEDRLPVVRRPKGASLRSFLKAIRDQVRTMQAPAEYEAFLSGRDEAVRLAHELEQASAPRLWHALLDETKHFIDDFWQELSPFHKRLFLRKYQGLWMSYRHPMPPSNARKIAGMLADGSLTVHSGYRGASACPDGQLTVRAGDQEVIVDYLIDASGTPADVREIDSPLVANLLRNGIVARCEFGGIECEPATHRVRPLSNVYVIGQLTRGRIFYVSAIERIAIHALVIAADLMRAVTERTGTRLEEVAD